MYVYYYIYKMSVRCSTGNAKSLGNIHTLLKKTSDSGLREKGYVGRNKNILTKSVVVNLFHLLRDMTSNRGGAFL